MISFFTDILNAIFYIFEHMSYDETKNSDTKNSDTKNSDNRNSDNRNKDDYIYEYFKCDDIIVSDFL